MSEIFSTLWEETAEVHLLCVPKKRSRFQYCFFEECARQNSVYNFKDYRICIHFHTEALLVGIEPSTPVKQATLWQH